MIAFELQPEHEAARIAIVQSWDEEKRHERDSMPLSEMLRCFESSYWVEERAHQRNKANHARRKLKRRGVL